MELLRNSTDGDVAPTYVKGSSWEYEAIYDIASLNDYSINLANKADGTMVSRR